MSIGKPIERPLKRPSIGKILRPYLGFVSLWIVINVFCEQLEEMSFLFETSFAVGQWLALRLYFRRSGYWMLMSVWGWIIASILIRWFELGNAISFLIPGASVEIIGLSITVQTFWTSVIVRSVEWIIIGFCQWLLLRCYIERAIWWLLASAIAGGIKGGLELTIRALDGGVWGAVAGAFGYGIITSIALVWLLHYNFERRQWGY